MLEIKQQLIPIGHPNRKGIKITPIAVVVHYTANDAPTATDTANVNYASRKYIRKGNDAYEADGKTSFRFGSAQWYMDQDSATLAIPQNEVAWGCGDRQLPYSNGFKGQTKIAKEVFGYTQNYKTINYEICNNDTIKNSTTDWDKACENAIEIIAKDMITYNIPINMVFRHHDISGKICPKPFVDNPKAWEDFKNKLANKIHELKNPTIKKTVNTSSLNVRSTPSANDNANIVGKLELNKIVDVYQVVDGWAKIKFNNKDAYVSDKYLK